ncbi:lysozyme inhibitor LprI family protein [Rhodovulum sp. P5]|uniref:lysozyme inhibitor LprI family protein n=1 Tax=Rhodovulum sp. P5 TaxID=1564506 RepID=UPI0009D96EC9|nr:lysozyme inhibitor LprI family protein [Rhodovulum sp. P5]
MTQAEMNQCAASAYTAADAELNAVWPGAKQAMDQMGAGALLLDAQRKWIAFRDAACAAERAPFEGGSIAPLIHYDCLKRLTERRTEDLRLLMN